MLSWWMILILFVYFFVCLVLMGIILIQAGKGGGLSSLGTASTGLSDALGATGAEKALNKITTGIAVGFMVLAIALSILGSVRSKRSSTERLFEGTPQQAAPPVGSLPLETLPAAPPIELPLPQGQTEPVASTPAPAPIQLPAIEFPTEPASPPNSAAEPGPPPADP